MMKRRGKRGIKNGKNVWEERGRKGKTGDHIMKRGNGGVKVNGRKEKGRIRGEKLK